MCVFTVLDTAIQSLCGINNMACFINKRESLSGSAALQHGLRHGALGLLIAGMLGTFLVPPDSFSGVNGVKYHVQGG